MNIFVFDIETIPDTEAGKKLYQLQELSEQEIAEAMFALRRNEAGTDFLRHYLHRVITISVVLRTPDKLKVWSLGGSPSAEKEIIERFFAGIERFTPTIVSWNGSGFDLPVLHYRALYHGINASRYFETGDFDQSFRWNNYLNRFHSRHLDLMDVLAGYQTRANAPLDEIALLLGYPGKMGMHGNQVWEHYCQGNIEGIRNYCETDVLNTYLVYLRFELLRGKYTHDQYQAECQRVKDLLIAENKPHFTEFLNAWDKNQVK